MKYTFRLIIILFFIALVVIMLYNRKQYQQISISEAVKTVEIIPVTTLIVKESQPIKLIRSAGSVQSVGKALVIAKVNGSVEEIYVSLGSEVKKSERMVNIENTYLREQWEIADKAYLQDLKDFERLKSLREVDAATHQQLEQFEVKVAASKTKANLAKKQLDECIVRAPVSGVINQLFINEGNQVGQGTAVGQIIGQNATIIQAGFDTEDVKYLKKGTVLRLLDMDLVYPFKGIITSIGTSKGMRGQVMAEISIEENDVLSHDKIVDLEYDALLPRGIYVPKKGILRVDSSNFVFLNQNRKAIRKKIVLGEQINDLVKVNGGIESGDRLILEGNHLIEEGDRIKEVSSSVIF
ncbi:MAG: efflux RND transporter periplasmic adaptor subunit [Bacteroidota bacterium]